MDKRRNRQSLGGQVMILFAAGVIVLIGVVAMAVDVGFLLAERRQNQAAVDSAALSAAQLIVDDNAVTLTQVETAGKIYGAPNANVSQDDVIVQWPVPGTGPYTGADFVRVTITKDVQKFFLGAIYGGNWQVTNTAVAAIEGVPKPYALVALNCPGMEFNGGVQVHIYGEGNAISNCDISNSGGSSLISVGGAIDAVGTIESNETWVAPDGINEGVDPATDPLANAAPPPVPGTNPGAPTCLNDPLCVMYPGYYNGLGTITVKNSVCMMPGTYYLDGNTKITLQGDSALLTDKSPTCASGGGGVLIYVAEGSTASIDPGNNGTIDLGTSYPAISPEPDPMPSTGACDPATEPYEDATCAMVLWIANGTPFATGGNADVRLEGVIYAPDSSVTLQGTSGSYGLQVIVGHLSLGGGGSGAFYINYKQYVKLDRPTVFLIE